MNHATPPEHDPYRRFVAGVLNLAYQDLVDDDEMRKLKATYFFDSRDYKVWADLIGLDHDVVMAGMRNVLTNGLPGGGKRRQRYQWGAHESRATPGARYKHDG